MATATQTAPAPGQEQAAPRPSAAAREERINVGMAERLLSLLGGGALTVYGASRRSVGGLALAAVGAGLVYRGATGHCPVYSRLGLDSSERRGGETSARARRGTKLDQTVTVQRPPEELYAYWRDFENLPRVFRHLKEVRVTAPGRSHWVVEGPGGQRFEWDAEVITDHANEVIAWRSLEGSDVDTAGSVHFRKAPGDRGTEVRVVMKYDPPGGRAADRIASLFGASPEQYVEEDLRRFKSVMETGTFPRTEGQPRGGGRR